MASIYSKKRSPFWYMEWRDPKSGVTLNRSTKLRRISVEHTRRARQLCAQRTADELEAPVYHQGKDGCESWKWVDGFLRMTFAGKTLSRYQQAWFAFSQFMAFRLISTPRQLQREEAEAYVAWRSDIRRDVAVCGVRMTCKNTALLDLKVMSRIMREAVHRKLAAANPFLQLGFKKDPVKPRPDILPNEMKKIVAALNKVKDEPMQISWKIAMLYARRISETSLPMEDIDLKLGTITFRNKGGAPRTKLLHPDLEALARKWKREKRKRTFELPLNFSKKWAKFFDGIGLPHITFHSTRVRVATQLMEEGVDQRIAMDYIDHSSVLVHRIYLRSRPSHQQAAVDALGSKRWSGRRD